MQLQWWMVDGADAVSAVESVGRMRVVEDRLVMNNVSPTYAAVGSESKITPPRSSALVQFLTSPSGVRHSGMVLLMLLSSFVADGSPGSP